MPLYIENKAKGKTGIDNKMCEINMKKYTYLSMPSPPNGTGSFASFEITYEIKKIEESIKAVNIETLCSLLFLFLIKTNPVINRRAVIPFKTACALGKNFNFSPTST